MDKTKPLTMQKKTGEILFGICVLAVAAGYEYWLFGATEKTIARLAPVFTGPWLTALSIAICCIDLMAFGQLTTRDNTGRIDGFTKLMRVWLLLSIIHFVLLIFGLTVHPLSLLLLWMIRLLMVMSISMMAHGQPKYSIP